ncbi:ATP-sensitive inward rectifier potassium channel 1-like isoform X1 [Platichthys flesus]|uniref:ATP-sensitive inward rectifier potassium channel 1-like isoform X1 n=2 Tax=Platichthys flesus TaxID=8260 RepID=UPI002DBD70B7|nr:ATP-sensitive inward rectifier potassium channel 1-like isoform X1 [Platichthys flesus]
MFILFYLYSQKPKHYRSKESYFVRFSKMLRLLHGHQSGKSRLVTKDGRCNIEFGNIKYSNHFAYLVDFWTTSVEIRWRFVFLLFVASFTGSWFIFSLLWYWIAESNGDLTEQNSTDGHMRCIDNVNGLTTAFLYSLETQTTIGYGGRTLTGHCASAVALLVAQSLIGLFINCFMCGVVMAKISSPKKRAKTVTFSKTAVICLKKESLCLLIRVANLRKTLLIGSQIYGKLLRTTTTPDGETIILDQVDIDFMVDAGKDNLFFVCPLTLYHMINASSPFYELSADTLPLQEFELVVFLDGTAESTSSSCQVRTSYIPQEIQWGYSFLPIISRTKTGKYHVDFSNFSKSVRVTTPHCVHCFDSDVDQKNHNSHSQQKGGIDNLGFQVIDLNDFVDITKM